MRAGQVIALAVLALLTIGVVMVNSAEMTVGPVGSAPSAQASAAGEGGSTGLSLRPILLSRPTVYMVLAVLAMAAASFLPLRGLAAGVSADDRPFARRRDLFLLAAAAVAFLVVISMAYWPGIGQARNGASRWVALTLPGAGRVTLQPSEIVKWGLVVVVAWYAVSRAGDLGRFWLGLFPALAAVGVVCIAIAKEDLGTAVLIAAAASVVLLAAGARLAHFLALTPLAAVALVALIRAAPYRVTRIMTFLDPYSDPRDEGYHMIQSMHAVSGGGGFGRGLGHGLQKFGYLPEDRTDFLYAVICEELGVFGAAGIAALYIAVLWAGWTIIRRQESLYLKLVGVGVLVTLGFQAIINQAVVTGLGPTKGIALPLVSAGGTGWILTAASLGLLIAIDRSTPDEAAEPGGRLLDAPENEAGRNIAPDQLALADP